MQVLPKDFIDSNKNSPEFDQDYLCEFTSVSNIIWSDWNDELHISSKAQLSTTLPLWIGMDFNVSPMSAQVFHKIGSSLHLVDEIQMFDSNIFEMCDEIQQRYPRSQQKIIIPDASGGARSTAAVIGFSEIKHLRETFGTGNVKVRSKNPNVADTITSVEVLLREQRLLVNPQCKAAISAFRNYSYKPNTRVPLKDGKYDHAADCIRYAGHHIFPYKKQKLPAGNLPSSWQDIFM